MMSLTHELIQDNSHGTGKAVAKVCVLQLGRTSDLCLELFVNVFCYVN